MQTAGLHIDNPLSLVKLVTSPLTWRTSFAVYLGWYFIAENMIKQFAYSISQSATLTALFTKESLAIRLIRNADLQLNKHAKESLATRSA